LTNHKAMAAALVGLRDWWLATSRRAVSEDEVRRRLIILAFASIDRTLDEDEAHARHDCYRDLWALEEKAKDPRGDDERAKRIQGRSNTWYLRRDGSLQPLSDPLIVEEQRQLLRRHVHVLGRSRVAQTQHRPDLVLEARRQLRDERKKRRRRGETLRRELWERGGGDESIHKRIGHFLSRERKRGELGPDMAQVCEAIGLFLRSENHYGRP
jgi:hypothetical protein